MNTAAITAAATRVSKTRARLIFTQPWFGQLSMRLHLREQAAAQIVTDGTSIIYDPKLVDGCDDTELLYLIARMTTSCALRHPYRCAGRNLQRWNEACALVVNSILADSNIKLPPYAKLEPRFNGMNAEMVYAILEREAQQQQQPQSQPQGGGESDESEEEDDQGAGDDEDEEDSQPGGDSDDEDSEEDEDADAEPDAGDSDEQDDADDAEDEPTKGGHQPQKGDFVPPEQPSKPEESEGEGDDGSECQPQPTQGAGQPDDDMTEADWEIACEQASQMSRGAGEMAGGLDRSVKAAKEAKQDWRAVLWRFVEQQIASDYSWTRPNRRFIAQDLYLPGVVKENHSRFALGNDTSGSVSQEYQQITAAELNSIMRELRPEAIDVIHADSVVQAVETVEPDNGEIELKAKGGGGTCFQPVFDWIAEQDCEYKAILFFSEDLENFDEITDPGLPVLWITPEHCRKSEMPFGEVIKISKY